MAFVGKGGSGKTTAASLRYQDDAVRLHRRNAEARGDTALLDQIDPDFVPGPAPATR